MPPITVTLTETEACHIRELIEKDKEASAAAIRLFATRERTLDFGFHELMVGLDDGLLEKFKDA